MFNFRALNISKVQFQGKRPSIDKWITPLTLAATRQIVARIRHLISPLAPISNLTNPFNFSIQVNNLAICLDMTSNLQLLFTIEINRTINSYSNLAIKIRCNCSSINITWVSRLTWTTSCIHQCHMHKFSITHHRLVIWMILACMGCLYSLNTLIIWD